MAAGGTCTFGSRWWSRRSHPPRKENSSSGWRPCHPSNRGRPPHGGRCMPGHELMLHPAVEQRLTLEALAAAAGLHSGLVEQFVAYGLLEPVSVVERVDWFDVG